MVLIAPPPSVADDLDAGVIEEARRRQRRRRLIVAATTLVAALVAFGALLAARGGGTTTALRPPRPPEPLPRLAGPVLSGPTHLRIVGGGDWGPPSILDVDRGTIRTVHGLGVPQASTLWSPRVTLTPAPAGVLAVVHRQACQRCARSQTEFLIDAGGSVRRLATQRLASGSVETAPARGSAATWVLTWPHAGPCTLRLVPAARVAVHVPCGSLAADTSAGVWIASAHREVIVDPVSGRIRARLAVTPPAYPQIMPGDELYPLYGDLALENSGQTLGGPTGTQFGRLRLVHLAGGTGRRLAWPSYFGDIVRVVPEPHGPLVAVDFGSPAYPGPAQAEDIWMLDTTTGTFTHLPAYPAQVDIKFSTVAWTSDDRLVIIAGGGGRTVLGLWKPGQATLPLRGLPNRPSGYSSSVPLVG
jgi:hypothetical protein